MHLCTHTSTFALGHREKYLEKVVGHQALLHLSRSQLLFCQTICLAVLLSSQELQHPCSAKRMCTLKPTDGTPDSAAKCKRRKRR